LDSDNNLFAIPKSRTEADSLTIYALQAHLDAAEEANNNLRKENTKLNLEIVRLTAKIGRQQGEE
jgi:flagellar basal body L-ring protein FlgH